MCSELDAASEECAEQQYSGLDLNREVEVYTAETSAFTPTYAPTKQIWIAAHRLCMSFASEGDTLAGVMSSLPAVSARKDGWHGSVVCATGTLRSRETSLSKRTTLQNPMFVSLSSKAMYSMSL